MEKAMIYTFSGSGNTLKISNLYKDEFEAKGIKTDVYQIGKGYENAPSAEEYDIVGFSYPIHAFNPPEIFVDFVKSLKPVQNKRTFIFKTSGEPLWMNKSSSQKILRILKDKGFDVYNERHIVMPYNMIFRHRTRLFASCIFTQGACKHMRKMQYRVKRKFKMH